MNPSFLLQSKTSLVNQLVFFDEEMSVFLDSYYSHHTKERKQVEQLLTSYARTLEQLLPDLDEQTLRSKVLIGSRVSFTYVEASEDDQVTIVFPHQSNPDLQYISFLSPIGLHLLLSATNDTLTVETPLEAYKVKIMDITFDKLGWKNGLH